MKAYGNSRKDEFKVDEFKIRGRRSSSAKLAQCLMKYYQVKRVPSHFNFLNTSFSINLLNLRPTLRYGFKRQRTGYFIQDLC